MNTLQTEYRRNLQKNELIIKSESPVEEDGYVLRMVEQNQIEGLLALRSSWKDGELYLHYDVTSRQSLESVFTVKMMNSSDLIRLLEGIADILELLQKYLLDPSQLLFDPQYMFLDSAQEQLYLCYLPGTNQADSIAELAEFLLKKLNHEDRQAVRIGYRFYQDTLTENFSLKKTLKEILSGERGIQGEREIQVEQKQETKRDDSGAPDNRYEQTIHKEQRMKKRPENFAELIFSVIHPAVLISGLILLIILELLFYFGMLNITETGGLFFLLISGEVLINQFWKKSRQPEKKERNDWRTEEYMEEYRNLREEFYQTPVQENDEEVTRCFSTNRQNNTVRLVCISGENGNKKNYPDIEVREHPLRIGKRKGESDVLIDSPTVSRIHAELIYENGKFYVKDLNSTNGTFRNGQKLNPQDRTELLAGDTVSFAEIEYLVYFTRNQ